MVFLSIFCGLISKISCFDHKTTNYFRDPQSTGSINTHFLYDELNQLYAIACDNHMYYYVRDILGNILGLVDNNGNDVIQYTYDAFGNLINHLVSHPNLTLSFNPFLYKGYYYDFDTKMYYCKSRYYVPEWGRWLNADDVGYLDPESINGLNLFVYCGNNPVMYVDPSGCAQYDILAWIGVGLVVSIRKRIKQAIKHILKDIKSFYIYNSNEDVTLDSNYFSFYKGRLVIRHDIPGTTSCAINGTIFLNKSEISGSSFSRDTLNHEWGHLQQEKMLGRINYLFRVAIPSVTNRNVNNYYSQPWEYTADLFGGVNRGSYTKNAHIDGLTYFYDSFGFIQNKWVPIEGFRWLFI